MRYARKEQELKRRMHELGVYEKDIREMFVRSSGPGGQNVNKTSTCVVLRHLPTGIQVKCQEERSQLLNRHQARWLVLQKIEEKQKQERLRLQQEKEKERRRRRKRTTALQEKVLEQKHYRSARKSMRRKIDAIDLGDDL
ncbi:MAG: peptide chain release factor-like protein [Candidatus Omnitrophica bacterium]|nr:peptide chain release factor-like protein [Candidatus Omnitrophota bacterium]